jgi:Carboxypeptidase regulatory-like domain/TonB dependent receptor/TonB-dependent Receptor Plug Domain
MGTMARRITAFLVGLLLVTSGAGAQERFGSLAGTVTDTTKAAVPGATVTATNKATGAQRVAVSGSDGSYRVPDLDPGRYSVTIELQSFQKVSVEDAIVLLGRTLTVDAELRPGVLTEVVSVTADATKTLDLGSVTLSHNVTSEEFDRLPKGRSFQSIAMAAPGVNSGEVEGGFQVNGASSAENVFTVDGVPTISLIYGSSRQNTVFEYLQEVQVKTGGIDAQYGGALGGVISAVTKSGGNTFTGEAHYYYIGNALGSSPVKRLVLDPVDFNTVGYFEDDKPVNNQNEFGGSIGGPIVRNRLFFFGSLSPRVVRRTNDYRFSNGTEPGSIDQEQTAWQGFGKVTYAAGRVHANASLLMTPTRSTGRMPAYDSTGTNFLTTSSAANEANRTRGFDADQNNVSGNVDLTVGNSGYLSMRGGYFYDNYKDTGVPSTTSYTYQVQNIGMPGIPVSLQGPVGTANTSRIQISNFDKTEQSFVQFDYNHALKGGHLLKGGWGVRGSVNDVDVAYPGGYVYLYWGQSFRSTATGQTGTGTYGYYRVDDLATRGRVQANIQNLYIQDTWTVGSRLTLNLGLRTENEKIPTFRPDIAKYAFQFGFADKLAPRLGATYDVRGDGRMKAFASWGRYYDWTKYEIARGSFGGDVWHIFYRSLDTLDIGSLNLNNMPGQDLWGSSTGFRDLRATAINNTDPNIKPMFQDSFNAGVDQQLGGNMALGIHYIHNNLGRTIEDMGALVNGDSVYVIGNPGEGQNTITPASYPATANFATPKPKRQYDALEITLERRFSKNWFGSANYTLSRLYGNYSGLANSDEIQTPTTGITSKTAQQQEGSIARQGSNAHTGWDIDEVLWDSRGNLNVLGRLGTDRPHVVKLYGAYQFNFGTQIGAFFYGGSGTPISTQVVGQDQYAPLVNGRGDMGRTPVLTRTDLLLSHELAFADRRRLRLELNIQNLFNQKTATHIFNYLNKGAPAGGQTRPANAIDFSAVNLAAGYDYNALILATQEGSLSYDPRYDMEDLFNPGLQGQFSVKFIF